jgi:hypothetical protein
VSRSAGCDGADVQAQRINGDRWSRIEQPRPCAGPFLGSTGLAVLVGTKKSAGARDIVLWLIATTRPVTRPLEVTGLVAMFTITGDPQLWDGSHFAVPKSPSDPEEGPRARSASHTARPS